MRVQTRNKRMKKRKKERKKKRKKIGKKEGKKEIKRERKRERKGGKRLVDDSLLAPRKRNDKDLFFLSPASFARG